MNRPSRSLANLYGGVYEPGKTPKYQLVKSPNINEHKRQLSKL